MGRAHEWDPPPPLPQCTSGQTCLRCNAVRLFFPSEGGETVTFYLAPEDNPGCDEEEEEEGDSKLSNRNAESRKEG